MTEQETQVIAPFAKQTATTVWQNNTKETITFRLFQPSGRKDPKGEMELNTMVDIVVKPGTSIELPSYLDSKLQRVEGGYIISGLATRLTKVGSDPVPLHPNLLPNADKKKK